MRNEKAQSNLKTKKGAIAMLIMAVAMFLSTAASAQNVSVSLSILPPYSPYYSDYSGINASKVLLVLQNTTRVTQTVKLIGSLKGIDNGISVTTYSNYVPLHPIVLNPLQSMQLSGAQIRDIFDLNYLSVVGVDKAKIAQTTRIPEGTYELCIQAVNYNSHTGFSNTLPSGCTTINISFPDPPVLINPSPAAVVNATTPQTLIFNWVNPGPVPLGTQYNIVMAEMPDVATDPTQVLNATSFPMLSQTVSSLGYIYSTRDLQLTPGKRYAWRVTASDPTHRFEFKNNGVSPAAYFTYGTNTPVASTVAPTPAANNLNVVTPNCSSGNGTVVLGKDLRLQVSWLWAEQIASINYFGTLDTTLTKHYTQTLTSKGMASLGNYRLLFTRVSFKLKNKGPSQIQFTSPAPIQDFSLSADSCIKMGFVIGESYTVRVLSLDTKGNPIDQNTSCPFLLKAEDLQAIPKLNIAGKLTYTLDKTNYHGANRANVTLQLSKDSVTHILSMGANGSLFPTQVIDNTRPYVTATTDDQGNYQAQLTLLPSDTGRLFLITRINSPYYQQPQVNTRVIIPKLSAKTDASNTATNGQEVTYHQDTLKVPDVKTNAYGYKLTVTVKKGFSGGISAATWAKTYGIDPSDYLGSSNPIDGFSMDTLAKVPAGIPVILYRKAKSADIPYYEGDGLVVDNSGASRKKTTRNSASGLKLSNGYSMNDQVLLVDSGTTAIVYDKNAKPSTVVVFNNLICNLEDKDEYYIKAKLSKKDTTGNSSEDLAAPEQRFSFTPSPLNWKVDSYTTTAEYDLISTKPPTAHVKGTVMYKWPSTPGVLRPYANQPISITMHASVPGLDTTGMVSISAGDCQYYPAEMYQVEPSSGNKPGAKHPVANYKDDLIVGQGVTDAAGKFDIQVIMFTQMGNVNVTYQQTGFTKLGETCEQIAADHAKKQKELQTAGINGANIAKHTGAVQTMQQEISDLGKQYQGLGGDGLTDDFGGNGGVTGTGGLGSGKSIFLGGGGIGGFTVDNNTGFQTQQKAATGNAWNANSSLFGGAANLPGGGLAPGINKGAGLQGQQSINGPNSLVDNEINDGPLTPATINGTIERYFSIDNLKGDLELNSDNTKNSVGHFVVQPFSTVDLGTIVTDVPELTNYQVKVYAFGQKTTAILSNAKVVVFRSSFAKKNEYPFQGEGSVNHPMQKLLSPSLKGSASYISDIFDEDDASGTPDVLNQHQQFNGTQNNYVTDAFINSYQEKDYGFDAPVEWVLDAPLALKPVAGTNYAIIDLSNLRLFKDVSQVSLQITPDAEGTGGSFDPVLVSLPVQNEVDTYQTTSSALVTNDQYGKSVIQVEGNTSPGKANGYNWVADTLYNTDPNGVYVFSKATRIAGRIMDGGSGKPISGATVNIKAGIQHKSFATDNTGYFEASNTDFSALGGGGQVNVGIGVTTGGLYTAVTLPDTTIQASGSTYYKVINLTPALTINGSVLGERKNGKLDSIITAYVMRDDSTIFSTKTFGNFTMPITPGMHKITVIPQDVAFFDDTISKQFTQGGNNNMYNTILLRRKHRMEFHITGIDLSQLPANTLKVIINNDPAKSAMVGANGIAQAVFENISVNKYSVQVLDMRGLGYVPKIFNVENEESKNFQVYNVPMQQGATIAGEVHMNNVLVKNARVYIEFNTTNEADASTNASAIETRTDKNGDYFLRGIPMNSGDQVTVHATLDTTFTVTGDKKLATISGKVTTVNLNLTRFLGPAITSVWGFPLSVESITPIDNFKYSVTGIVDLSKNNSSFGWMDPGSKIRISNVVFSSGQLSGNGDMQPTASYVVLDEVTTLKMKYLNRYNVLLNNAINKGNFMGRGATTLPSFTPTPLTIEKSGSGGAVFANVSITDNTFNFPSSYLSFANTGEFYLSEPAAGSGPNNTNIKAIASIQDKSGMGLVSVSKTPLLAGMELPGYYLSDIGGNALQFSFIGFKTTANPLSSYIGTSGKIHLDATMKGNIPHSDPGDIDIRIKNLVLDGNAIAPSTGTDAISVNLQSWKLLINNWKVDPTVGGLISNNSIIKTGIVDIPVKTFNLRSDLLVIKDFDVKNISLGGGLLPLTITDTSNAHLVYDMTCGSDQKPHWRFSATTLDGTPVAGLHINPIANKTADINLKIDYFQLVSYNNENLLDLSGGQNGIQLYDNNKFLFFPGSISSDIGSFTLGGNAKILVPRITDQPINIVFTKAANGLDMNPSNFKVNFEGPGYVQYTYDGSPIKSANHTTSMYGTVVEPNKINPIPCTFTFGNSDAGTITLNKFNLNLNTVAGPPTGSTTMLNIDSTSYSGMKVDATKDWSTLKFNGLLMDPQSGGLVAGQAPRYNFEVLGDISASSKQLQVNQINTPLGDVDMTYDFATKEMHGALHMDKVAFGTNSFSGDVEMDYGPQGMLFMGAGQLNTGTLLVDGFGTFNIGLLFANTTLLPPTIAKVTQYSKAVQSKCWLGDNSNNFKGFFLTGGYDIVNEHDGINLGIVDAYFNAVLGVEFSVGANFAKSNYMALAGAHGDVDAGLDAITGTSISGGVHAHLTAEIGYSPNGFKVTGDAGMKIGYQVSQYIPLIGTKTFNASTGGSVVINLEKHNTKFKFSLNDNVDTLCDDVTQK